MLHSAVSEWVEETFMLHGFNWLHRQAVQQTACRATRSCIKSDTFMNKICLDEHVQQVALTE